MSAFIKPSLGKLKASGLKRCVRTGFSSPVTVQQRVHEAASSVSSPFKVLSLVFLLSYFCGFFRPTLSEETIPLSRQLPTGFPSRHKCACYRTPMALRPNSPVAFLARDD